MRLLYVTSRLPFPPLRGDQIIAYYRLKLLSGRHQVTLATFYEDDRELEHLNTLAVHCERVIPVKLKAVTRLANLLGKGLFSALPLQVAYYLSREFRRTLADLRRGQHYDIVHTYLLRMAEYTQDLSGLKVIDLVDSMQLNIARRLPAQTRVMRRIFREELRRMQSYEKQVVRQYDASIVVSQADREYLDSSRVVDIPVGVDTEVFAPRGRRADNKTIVFSGNMGYQPNETAARWFLDNCFPPIKQKIPDARLLIVGARPSRRVRAYHNGQDVLVKGFVPSMSAELNSAQIAICPVCSGYGMHTKILESMSCGLPVVATSSSVGSIRATHRRDIISADEPGAFSAACLELLRDGRYASEIGARARELVVSRYDWRIHVQKLEELYLSLLSHQGRTL